MPTPPSPTIAGTTTLSAIQTKVRRLTRSLSEQQLSTADLNNYINTFVVYDFPEQLRTFNLRTDFTFWCNPFQDVYPTDLSLATTDPLYNFQNLYLTVHPPAYVAGFQAFFSQSPQQFWNIYPFVNSIQNIGVQGDGSTTSFSGVINTSQAIVPPGVTQQICLEKNNVLFDSIDSNNNGLSMIDTPVSNTYGNLAPPGIAVSALIPDPTNFVNYITGAFTVTFTSAPGPQEIINSQTVNLSPARPQSILYYADTFTLRPIPDQPYAINFEVYQRPTALLNGNQSPELEEYWQLISYGAARKVLQDRMDIETVQLIEPEFREQMNLCLRRTIVQLTNERSATIYTQQNGINNGWWGFGNGTGNQ